MIEHCMLVPDPEDWATKWRQADPGLHACGLDGSTGNDNCQVCNEIPHYFPTTEVDPTDPCPASINIEADKASVEARVDQTLAHQRSIGPDS